MPLPIPLGVGFGVAFIGRMCRGSYGSTFTDTVNNNVGWVTRQAANPTQYAVAANATLANLGPDLSTVEGTPAGWNSQRVFGPSLAM